MKRIRVKSLPVTDGIDSIQTVESTVVTTENHLQETSLWANFIPNNYLKSSWKNLMCLEPEIIGRNQKVFWISKLKIIQDLDTKLLHVVEKMELRHFETTLWNNWIFKYGSQYIVKWSFAFMFFFSKTFHSNVPVCYRFVFIHMYHFVTTFILIVWES